MHNPVPAGPEVLRPHLRHLPRTGPPPVRPVPLPGLCHALAVSPHRKALLLQAFHVSRPRALPPVLRLARHPRADLLLAPALTNPAITEVRRVPSPRNLPQILRLRAGRRLTSPVLQRSQPPALHSSILPQGPLMATDLVPAALVPVAVSPGPAEMSATFPEAPVPVSLLVRLPAEAMLPAEAATLPSSLASTQKPASRPVSVQS